MIKPLSQSGEDSARQQQVKNLLYELNRTTLLIADLVTQLEQEGILPQAITSRLIADCTASHRRLKQLEPRAKS